MAVVWDVVDDPVVALPEIVSVYGGGIPFPHAPVKFVRNAIDEIKSYVLPGTPRENGTEPSPPRPPTEAEARGRSAMTLLGEYPALKPIVLDRAYRLSVKDAKRDGIETYLVSKAKMRRLFGNYLGWERENPNDTTRHEVYVDGDERDEMLVTHLHEREGARVSRSGRKHSRYEAEIEAKAHEDAERYISRALKQLLAEKANAGLALAA